LAAVGLIAAVAIDPQASTEPLPRATPTPPPTLMRKREAPTPPIAADEPVPLPPSPTRSYWMYGFGVGAWLLGGVSPGVSVGGGWYGETLNENPVFPFAMRLSVLRTITTTTSTELGDASFRLTASRLTGCVLGWPAEGAVRARPCLFADLGSLEARGENTHDPGETSLLWRAVGMTARVEVRLLRRVYVGGEGGILLPLLRDSFYFRPERTIHTIPGVTGTLGLDVGLRLP
jgi:hypothetical protein